MLDPKRLTSGLDAPSSVLFSPFVARIAKKVGEGSLMMLSHADEVIGRLR